MVEWFFAILSSVIFGFSWLFQVVLSKKHQKPKVDKRFFLLRSLGGIFLVIHFYILKDWVMVILSIPGFMVMGYNIHLGFKAIK